LSSQNIARKEVVACTEREDKGLGSLIDGELLRTLIDGQYVLAALGLVLAGAIRSFTTFLVSADAGNEEQAYRKAEKKSAVPEDNSAY
jgi:hypothetical protein